MGQLFPLVLIFGIGFFWLLNRVLSSAGRILLGAIRRRRQTAWGFECGSCNQAVVQGFQPDWLSLLDGGSWYQIPMCHSCAIKLADEPLLLVSELQS